MMTLGEVHTGLLQNSGDLPEPVCRQILGLAEGGTIRVSRRPIIYALSPDRLTGVDCRLPSVSQARVRGVGTVISRCAITGGRVAQASSHALLVRDDGNRRLPWSHYLTRPGVVEVLGGIKAPDVRAGFFDRTDVGCLNLGEISGRFLDLVQSSPAMDRRPPFKVARTRMRWVAETGEPSIRLTLRDDGLRTVHLVHVGEFTPAVHDFFEDLALHDWLLTTLLAIVERAHIGATAGWEPAHKLAPAINHLLHLWMPAARLDDALTPFWASLDRRPGFTRQWRSLVNRIRDHIALSTLASLGGSWPGGR